MAIPAFLLFFWKRANCARIVPAERIEVGGPLGGGHFQVVAADDVVAVENRLCFVAGDHHGDALRNAGTDHIAAGRSAEIMEDPPADVGLFTGRAPSAPVITDRAFAVPARKNQRAQLAANQQPPSRPNRLFANWSGGMDGPDGHHPRLRQRKELEARAGGL